MSNDGFDQRLLARVTEVIQADISRGLYHGAVLRAARGGKVGLDIAIGAGDAKQAKPLRRESVFSIFSVTKAFTNVLTLRALALGQFALPSRRSEVIPQFLGHRREHIPTWHLPSHPAGFP